eukprot:2841036-Pyramimonas_sp.AAC.1
MGPPMPPRGRHALHFALADQKHKPGMPHRASQRPDFGCNAIAVKNDGGDSDGFAPGPTASGAAGRQKGDGIRSFKEQLFRMLTRRK